VVQHLGYLENLRHPEDLAQRGSKGITAVRAVSFVILRRILPKNLSVFEAKEKERFFASLRMTMNADRRIMLVDERPIDAG
jgi:hypothetical protein